MIAIYELWLSVIEQEWTGWNQIINTGYRKMCIVYAQLKSHTKWFIVLLQLFSIPNGYFFLFQTRKQSKANSAFAAKIKYIVINAIGERDGFARKWSRSTQVYRWISCFIHPYMHILKMYDIWFTIAKLAITRNWRL